MQRVVWTVEINGTNYAVYSILTDEERNSNDPISINGAQMIERARRLNCRTDSRDAQAFWEYIKSNSYPYYIKTYSFVFPTPVGVGRTQHNPSGFGIFVVDPSPGGNWRLNLINYDADWSQPQFMVVKKI